MEIACLSARLMDAPRTGSGSWMDGRQRRAAAVPLEFKSDVDGSAWMKAL
jgi:hypothetical protein